VTNWVWPMYEITLLKKLIALNTDSTTKENYKECAQLIVKEAKKLGMKTKIINAPAPEAKHLDAGHPTTRAE